MKHFLFRLAAVLLLLSASLPAGAQNFESGGLWYFIQSGYAVVNGASDLNAKSLVIPESVTYSRQSYPVEVILGSAFNYMTALEEVTLPQSLKTIGRSSFKNCKSLTDINIPANVTKIGERAFEGCDALINVTFEASDKEIDLEYGSAFYDVNIESLTLNRIVPNVAGAHPRNVTFGDVWVTIPDEFLSNQTSLTSVSLSENLQEIGDLAFTGCNSLVHINFPESLKRIGQSAFYDCEKLQSPVFGSNLESLDYAAFYNCKSVTELNIPGSVIRIWSIAFNGCDNLHKVTFEASDKEIDIFGDIFGNLNIESMVLDRVIPNIADAHPAEVIFGDGWQIIPYEFLRNQTSLTSVSLPETLTEIGEGAFEGCTELPEITLPNSLKIIGNYAFSNCEKLKSPVFGSNLEVIKYMAFYNCKAFTEINIPGSVKEIGERVFEGCSDVTNITFEKSQNEIDIYGNTFQDLQPLSMVLDRVIPNIADAHPAEVIFGDGWQIIPYEFLRNQTSLTSVSLPETLTEIGEGAFEGCSNIMSIKCDALTPPVCMGDFVFSTDIYPVATLYVPTGSIRLYSEADVWKNFININAEGIFLVTVDYDHQCGEVTLNGKSIDSLELYPGESLDVVITPTTGYTIKSVFVNGEDLTESVTDGLLHFVEIDRIMNITVEFEPIMLMVWVTESPDGGFIMVNGTNDIRPLPYGTCIEIRPVVYDGYILKSLTIDGVAVELNENGAYVIESLEHDIYVDAVFEEYNSIELYNSDHSEKIIVSSHDNTIFINGAPSEAIAGIYDTAGRCVYLGTERAIAIGEPDLYIVTVADRSFKIMVK